MGKQLLHFACPRPLLVRLSLFEDELPELLPVYGQVARNQSYVAQNFSQLAQNAELCYAMLRYVILCYVMLCYKSLIKIPTWCPAPWYLHVQLHGIHP